MSSITVFGDWQNAWVTAVCLASYGHQVTLVSRTTELDLHEPGLKELRAPCEASGHFRRIHPEQYGDVHVPGSEYAWIALDTPLDDGGGPNPEPVRLAAGRATLRSDKIIVSSQVPLGFCQKLEDSLCRHVAYVPENMRLGHGIETFCQPDRLVIGSTDRTYGNEVAQLLQGRWTQQPLPIFVNLPTAEMIKHATNAFLATSISLVNELATLSQDHGVNMDAVSLALRSDARIGPDAYVVSGPGFAGGTLERDLKALQRLGPTPLLDAVLLVNAQRPHPRAPSCPCDACRKNF